MNQRHVCVCVRVLAAMCVCTHTFRITYNTYEMCQIQTNMKTTNRTPIAKKQQTREFSS